MCPAKLSKSLRAPTVQLKVAFVTSEAEFDAATVPDMDVKVVGQPEAAKLEKDNAVRFTGTLVSYDPDPAFMLHWDKAKVKEEDIPKEEAQKARAAAARSQEAVTSASIRTKKTARLFRRAVFLLVVKDFVG